MSRPLLTLFTAPPPPAPFSSRLRSGSLSSTGSVSPATAATTLLPSVGTRRARPGGCGSSRVWLLVGVALCAAWLFLAFTGRPATDLARAQAAYPFTQADSQANSDAAPAGALHFVDDGAREKEVEVGPELREAARTSDEDATLTTTAREASGSEDEDEEQEDVELGDGGENEAEEEIASPDAAEEAYVEQKGQQRQPERDWFNEERFWQDVKAGRKANATLVFLVKPGANLFSTLIPTLQNIELQFNGPLGYPIQLLTDKRLPSEAMQQRTAAVTHGKAKWALLEPSHGWGPPSWITEDDIAAGLKRIRIWGTGYRNMCRFYSRFYHQHPATASYEWLWRLDEGITFHCQLQDDPFFTMQANNKIYGALLLSSARSDQRNFAHKSSDLASFLPSSPRSGYDIIRTENPRMVPTLWKTTQDFMQRAKGQHPEWFPAGTDESFVSDDGGKTYSLNMYYNNFEIVHRSFLESEPYQAYTQYLDEAKGFYRERWGDAPVRTLALAHFLPADQTHSFANVTGYKHGSYAFVCPDLPWCSCDPKKSKHNGNRPWVEIRGPGESLAPAPLSLSPPEHE
ncbi:hypothetical protein JCM10207_006162 [Rhodosporidiobolus poonsookiae]